MKTRQLSPDRYDAFISYSHRQDRVLAEALQSELERFARPWYRARALRVFRDATNLSAAPALWPTIEHALAQSDWFVLIASPAAAESAWVQKEVQWWASNCSADRILITLTDGQIHWAGTDFDWCRTDAVPRLLSGVFSDEPLWVDLRKLRPASTSETSAGPPPRLGDIVAEFAAPIHGRDKDTMVGEHLSRQRRTRRLVQAVVAVLSVLLLAVSTVGFIAIAQKNEANKQRERAVRQARIAVARQLTVQAEAARDSDPRTALLLGIAAARIQPGAGGEANLVQTLTSAHYAGTLTGHRNRVWSAAFSPDGRTLATADGRTVQAGSDNATVRLWHVTNHAAPTLVATLPRHERVWSIAFAPDGRTLAVGLVGGAVQLWNVADRARPRQIGTQLDGPSSDNALVAYAPDGRTLAAGYSQDGTVRLWNVEDPAAPRLLSKPLTGFVESLNFRNDSRVLAVGTFDGEVRLWNVADPARPTPLGNPLKVAGSDSPVTAVAFSPDGRTLATGTTVAGSFDGVLRLWDLANPAKARPVGQRVPGNGAVEAVAFSQDGRTLVTGSNLEGGDAEFRVREWNITDRARPTPIGGPLPYRYGGHLLAYNPVGHTVAVGGDDSTVVLWDLDERARPAERGNLPHNASVHSVTFTPDSRLAVTGSDDETLRVWDVADPDRPILLSRVLDQDGAVRTVAFSPDGRILASGAGTIDGGTVRLWDMTNSDRPTPLGQPLSDYGNIVAAVAFSPDGRTLASGDWAGTVRLLDVSDPARPRTLSQPLPARDGVPPANINSLAFSPDGRTLATASGTKVLLWDVANRARPTLLSSPLHHGGDVESVAFSPDGHILATASTDNTVRLWDLTDRARPALLGAPLLHNEVVESVAFSPDGRILATGSFDGAVRLWNLTDPEVLPIGNPLQSGSAVWSLAFSPNGRSLAAAGEDGNVRLWDVAPADFLLTQPVELACALTGRGLDRSEWSKYISGLPYRDTCAA
jgi:WD40 repeat protein